MQVAPGGSFLLLEENGGAGKRLRADNDQPVFEEPPAGTPSPLSPFVAPARGPPAPPSAAAACTPETSPCKEQRGGHAVPSGPGTASPPLPAAGVPITPDTAGPRAVGGFTDLAKRSPSPVICFFIFHIIQAHHLCPRCESTPLSVVLMLDSAGTLVEEILRFKSASALCLGII